jgi:hypothetical protein
VVRRERDVFMGGEECPDGKAATARGVKRGGDDE